MSTRQQSSGKVRIGFKQVLSLLMPYVRKRLMDQIRAVSVIIVCLVLFQTLVLRIPVAQAWVISLGMGLVIFGLMFFMEGLFLGIMPLGELIGVLLPRKSRVWVILIFSFILGCLATLAEPAIGTLKTAGITVKPWDAPVLFIILNRASGMLVAAVGLGVGLAVVFGMLRFLYNWSLKPFLFILVSGLLGLTVAMAFNPNLITLAGVAWDCGGVTTGPVTVPLVLALGIGISRVVGRAGSGVSGFGVVSLASLFPILTVSLLGVSFLGSAPDPMPEHAFYTASNRTKAEFVFKNRDDMIGYTFKNASLQSRVLIFNGNQDSLYGFLRQLAADPGRARAVFGTTTDALNKWAVSTGTAQERVAVFGTDKVAREFLAIHEAGPQEAGIDFADLFKRNAGIALQAVILLGGFLILALLVILREKLPRPDEVAVGLTMVLVGMSLFNCGLEIGLARIGSQVGDRLPSSFKTIVLSEGKQVIRDFDTSMIQTAVRPDGRNESFFYAKINNRYTPLPFNRDRYDASLRQYTHLPTWGPLFGRERGMFGLLVVLLFAFIMGYGATIAEPALNALGTTVEELSVGTFKKNLLIQCVAIGVGIGLMFGVARILWNLPLWVFLLPPYLITLVLTIFSTEEYTNIGWDSGGVTTGPITVPLVLAMGLGVGGQMGVVEGFGILAMASIWPVMLVLGMGLVVNRKRALRELSALEEIGGTGV